VQLQREDLVRMYRLMLQARLLDERTWQLNRQGKAPFVISCQGHEAAQVGSAYALRPGKDWAAPYYRDLAFVLTLGLTPRDHLLSVLAKGADPNSGARQMPAHYSSRPLNIVSVSSPTGTQAPHAVGVGLAIKLRGDDAVVWTSFGDGTSSEGDIHEAMNMAAVHRLPVIFCVQNNGYAISVPQRKQMVIENVADRAAGYGFPGITVDGTDIIEVYEATAAAVERARRGDGPTLIEAKCIRMTAHSSDDNDRTYRPAEELRADRAHEPLARFAEYLRAEGLLDDESERALREELQREIDQATLEAEAASLPDPATVERHVFQEL
jgi:2-oxoisovalerate dehydrogenase E1 component alpha subunit